MNTHKLPIAAIERAHGVYLEWLDNNWLYSRWAGHSHRMIFWYGIAGASFAGGSKLADEYLDYADRGKFRELPGPKVQLWRSALTLVSDVKHRTGMEFVPWLTQARADFAWDRLQEVRLIGPKIAGWVMRDISVMLDYGENNGPARLRYRQRRDPRWFRALSTEEQKYFVPIDRHVFKAAKQQGALSRLSTRNGLSGLLSSRSRYLAAASEIADFARRSQVDVRDLDAYWYMVGSKWIDKDGYEMGQ